MKFLAMTESSVVGMKDPQKIAEARERLKAKFSTSGFSGARVLTARAPEHDDSSEARARSILKKLNMQTLAKVDAVVLHHEDETALQFDKPKVAFDPRSNLFAVTGKFSKKQSDQIPTAFLQKILEQQTMLQAGDKNKTTDEDDDIPALVEDFEAVATAQNTN